MEFCQIQLNYLDWTLQNAKEKCELLKKYGIPVWVMEPVRGGKLAALPQEDADKLKALRPDSSIPSWCFRWLQGIPEVKMILSGMSSFEQMVDNVSTFEKREPLSDSEEQLLFAIAEKLKNAIPCTACRYCCHGCPKELDIPMLIALYNDLNFSKSMNISMRIDAIDRDKLPEQCIGCGQCTSICPQGIDVPKHMADMTEAFAKLPKWADICRDREEAARKRKMQ